MSIRSISLLLLVSLAFVVFKPLRATGMVVDSRAEQVTIYHNGALVDRHAPVDLEAGTHELRLQGVSGRMVLKSLKVANKEVTILNKRTIKKLSEEQYQQLLDQRDALTAQLSLLEMKYKEVGFIDEVAELEQMMKYYAQKIQEIKRQQRSNERALASAKDLEGMQVSNEDAAILVVTLSLSSAIDGDLIFQYIVGGIGWSSAHEISVTDASERTLTMKYMARVMNQTGENWSSVSVSLSSASPIGRPVTLPQPTNPWVLGGNADRYLENAGVQGVYNMQWGAESDIEQIRGVEYQQISVPSFLEARRLEGEYSIPSNGTIFTFPILTVDLPAVYYYYGYPGLDPEVYLVAEISGWETLGLVDGVADITYRGNAVGRSLIRWSEVEEALILPIGRDSKVFMNRSEIADQKYFKETWSSRKRKTTLAYEMSLKNNNAFAIDFRLIEQIPVSQTKSAEVEMEESSGGAVDLTKGEVKWTMELAAGESVKKQLVYTIDMDAGFDYSRKKSKGYRTIASPSF